MALLFRLGFSKLPANGLSKRLCKVPQLNNEQVVFISGKILREKNRKPRPKPFNYIDKDPPSLSTVFLDPMMGRFDENSKIVLVEGPIGAGKDKFARKLAEELEMHYMPQPSLDEFYINPYGFDTRSFNSQLSPKAQLLDIPMYLKNPKHVAVARMQRLIFHRKFNQYLYALLHLLSTGEGVVLNRSFYTDIIFMTAMRNAGYIREIFFNFCKKELARISKHVLRPHLVVYLDIPVEEVQARIKKRNIPYEMNSQVLTKEYLTDMENTYKDVCLPTLSSHAHVLTYDATNELDMQDIVWDIEELDFESEKEKPKMSDWIFNTVEHIRIIRNWLHAEIDDFSLVEEEYDLDVDELFVDAEDMAIVGESYDHLPEYRFAPGFNKEMGESYLFKFNMPNSEVHLMHKEAVRRAMQAIGSK